MNPWQFWICVIAIIAVAIGIPISLFTFPHFLPAYIIGWIAITAILLGIGWWILSKAKF